MCTGSVSTPIPTSCKVSVACVKNPTKALRDQNETETYTPLNKTVDKDWHWFVYLLLKWPGCKACSSAEV